MLCMADCDTGVASGDTLRHYRDAKTLIGGSVWKVPGRYKLSRRVNGVVGTERNGFRPNRQTTVR